MRLYLLYVVPLLLAGQEPPKPAEAKPEPKKEEASPVYDDPKTGGWVELGYRWNSQVRGSLDTYRSIVNLGEGPRLLAFEYRLMEAPAKIWNRLDISASGWGGDPAAWLRADASKTGVYRMRLDHRDTAYFNAMPTFANPLLERGVLLNQRAFDTRRKYSSLQLDLRPGKKLQPYFGWTRDSGDGRGVTTFVTDGNEYPVANLLDDRTQNFRGGVEWTLGKGHLTMEQGGLIFDDNQEVATADRNPGNRLTPFLGRQLYLGQLLQSYRTEGHSYYSKVLGGWQAASWLDLSGSFLFSQPSSNIVYSQANRGLFTDLDTLLFADQQSIRWAAAARQPHSSGSATAEIRPLQRIRILESWFTDRFHNSSGFDRLVWNQSQQQLDVMVEASRWLTLRGGHRYTWGDGSSRGALFSTNGIDSGRLRRHTWTAGGTLRVRPKFSLFGDMETARSSEILFRTSLGDFEKFRARARYDVSASLSLQLNAGLLNNSNPPRTGQFDVRQRQASAAVQWLPSGGKRLRFTGEYARSSLRTSIDYTIPQTFQRDVSRYSDHGHTVSALVESHLPGGVTLNAGGAMYRSSGSRPSHFYQPQIRLGAPAGKHLQLFGEYRWFSFFQPFYLVERFRAHQFMAGVRVAR